MKSSVQAGETALVAGGSVDRNPMPSRGQAIHQAVKSLHKSLVEIPSLSTEEKAISDYLEAQLVTEESLSVARMGNNLCITLGEGPRTLLLNTHLDVVPPSADHPFDPFKAVERDGLIYGRGSVDAKASVAAMTTSITSLAKQGYQPPNGKVILALTVCEELGGIQNGLESILSLLPYPDAAIVGEPTLMQPCVAQKGLLILRMVSRGKTAHAARAHLGENAITRAASDIQRLDQMTLGRVHPDLGPTTVTITMIEGGTAKNVVPDRCTTMLDVRTTPMYTHSELVDLVRSCVESDIQIHSDRLIPVDTDATEAVVRACLEANRGAKPFGSPTLSDWIFLKGIPTVKMGPGDSRLSHRAEEHVPVRELERGVDIYRKTIESYFQQDPIPDV